MALLRFSPDLDPVSNLLTLQTELERFLRNPAIRLGVFGTRRLSTREHIR
jgi:hypothetical protein